MGQLLNDDLQRQLMELFLVEAREHIQTINQNLLAMEDKPIASVYSQLLNDTLRETHSLKGAARTVNINAIESLSHLLETLFVVLQNNNSSLDDDGYNLVYKSMDEIGNILQKSSANDSTKINIAPLSLEIEKLTTFYRSGKQNPKPPSEPSPKINNKDNPTVEINKPESNKSSSPATPTPTTIREHNQSSSSKTIKDQPVASVMSSVKPEETVRLTTSKLDKLVTLMNELQIARMGSLQNLSGLQEIMDNITAWDMEWKKAKPQIKKTMGAFSINSEQVEDNMSVFNNSFKDHNNTSRVVGFLQDNETHLRTLKEQLYQFIQSYKKDNHRLDQVINDVEDEIYRTRMMPISMVFNTYTRMVRDLAKERGKEASLIICGGETDVDRMVLEQIKDPILHLLRNCIDHGLEHPKERIKAGKPAKGSIYLEAKHQGENLIIEIADDGAGISLDNIRTAAIKKQLITKETAETLNEHDTLWLVFRSGFSTSQIITNISGRGLGLDIVRKQIELLHGMIDIENKPGNGVKFILSIPLTVATTQCLLIQAGFWQFKGKTKPCVFAIPVSNVIHLQNLVPEDIHYVEGRQVIRSANEYIMVQHLADVLGVEINQNELASEKKPSIIVGVAEKRMAFMVDSVIGAQDLVIKSLPHPFLRIRNTAGATILGSGDIIILLNIADLFYVVDHKTMGKDLFNTDNEIEKKNSQLILVADDSITTRTLEKNILESAGYEVVTAADGVDAWSQIHNRDFDLLVSDVVMPGLDGFNLTARIRTDDQIKHLPIILITSLDSRNERERGIQAGADAYIVKSAFDQEILLDTIRRLI